MTSIERKLLGLTLFGAAALAVSIVVNSMQGAVTAALITIVGGGGLVFSELIHNFRNL